METILKKEMMQHLGVVNFGNNIGSHYQEYQKNNDDSRNVFEFYQVAVFGVYDVETFVLTCCIGRRLDIKSGVEICGFLSFSNMPPVNVKTQVEHVFCNLNFSNSWRNLNTKKLHCECDCMSLVRYSSNGRCIICGGVIL